MNSRSISTYSNLQFFLISNKECALAHSCACGGRLRHLHCTSQCASLAERFIYQENTFLIYKKRDTNKCISLKYCFIHSYVGIIQIRLWVEVLNFLSAWYTSSPCFLHMISIKACLIDVNRFSPSDTRSFPLLFTQCATSNASRHFKSPLAMGRDAFKPKHASSVSISGVIDTGVNSNY